MTEEPNKPTNQKDNNQTGTSDPGRSDLSSLMNGSNSPTGWVPSHTPPPEPPQGTPPAVPTKQTGSRPNKKGMLLVGLILLLLILPVSVYYISQRQQIADIRDRAYGSCSTAGQPCDTNPCCADQDLYCTGVQGSRVCNVYSGPNTDCGAGFSCTRYIGFSCAQLSGGTCTANPQVFTSWDAAVSYANGCGQVDQVCNGGARENELCGDFMIIGQSCSGGGGNSPTPTTPSGNTNTPTPTLVIGQCDDIRVYFNGQLVDLANHTLKPGDPVIIAVAGTNADRARISINNGTFTESNTKNANNEYTFEYIFPDDGILFYRIEAEVLVNGIWL